jgi:hypothetical protein
VGGNEEAFEEKEENLQVNQILEIDGKKGKGRRTRRRIEGKTP